MKSYSICFSVVTFRHDISFIEPLLRSINTLSLNSASPLFNFQVLLHENIHTRPFLDVHLVSHCLGNVDFFYSSSPNKGFGFGHNHNFSFIDPSSYSESLFVVCNPDISFIGLDLLDLFMWVLANPSVSVASPLIIGTKGIIQRTAKSNPTFLSLTLGRLHYLTKIPPLGWYYNRHISSYLQYENTIIPSTYLSGCFLVIPSSYYNLVNGFDQKYFLHLEDADICRTLATYGLSLHVPLASVIHDWARSSHSSLTQMYHIFRSYCIYIRKWGFVLF